MVKTRTPRGETVYWIGAAGAAADAGPGTDFHAVAANRVSVTPLQVDLTHHAQLGMVTGVDRPVNARGSQPLGGIGMTSQRTRERMIERLREQGIRDETVLAAMGEVPRHLFVDEALASRAYEDTALPIGFGQTISQPYVVARMIEALGAGGARSARCSRSAPAAATRRRCWRKLAREVYSVERIRALLERARANLRGLRLSNLRLTYGDGNLGLDKAAPFDSIIVAAAAPEAAAGPLTATRAGWQNGAAAQVAGRAARGTAARAVRARRARHHRNRAGSRALRAAGDWKTVIVALTRWTLLALAVSAGRCRLRIHAATGPGG